MKFFKRHKTKDKAQINVGIRECRTCDNNIRCEECAYPKENEILRAEIEDARIGVKSYKGKYESAVKTTRELQTLVDEQQAEIERLNEAVDALTQQIMKPFHEEREKCIKCEKELKISAMQDFWNELKKRSTLDWRIVSTITGDNLLNEIKNSG